MLADTKNFAKAGLQAVQNQTENDSDMFENNILIQHDPARRPSTLTRNQTMYLIHLGPCQPELSVYHSLKHGLMITLTWSTVFRKTKLFYCFVCSIFGKEGHERGRSENAWIEGIDDWSKMKGWATSCAKPNRE